MATVNILFLTMARIEDVYERGIYTDLIRALAKEHHITVVAPREKRFGLETQMRDLGNIKLLNVKVGNLTQNSSLIKKGLATLTIEWLYEKSIARYIKSIEYDLIIYSTPPITFNRLVSKLKRTNPCKTLLLLKDIFPQNAVDLQLIKAGGIVHRYFRRIEKRLYALSDYIGCMSKANVNYVLNNNPDICVDKVFVFPNCIDPIGDIGEKNVEVLNKYQIPADKTLFLYAGNIGFPQGPKNIALCAEKFADLTNAHLLIIGSGSGYEYINSHILNNSISNVTVLEYLPKNEYDNIARNADVGLVFLDHRFTIPNFPSRLTSYMELGLPILAATDCATDIGEILREENCGEWCRSDDYEGFGMLVMEMSENAELRKSQGENARKCLEKRYIVADNVKMLMSRVRLFEKASPI